MRVSYNGFEEWEAIPGGWFDGITLGTCENAQVYRNQLIDNTDVDLIVGSSGSTGCSVFDNTISHIDRYGFAGLMLGFNVFWRKPPLF